MKHFERFTPRHRRFLRQARNEPTCYVDKVFVQYIEDLQDEGLVLIFPGRWPGTLDVRPAVVPGFTR